MVFEQIIKIITNGQKDKKQPFSVKIFNISREINIITPLYVLQYIFYA